MEPLSLVAAAKRYADEPAAWEYMESLRWHGKPACPHCGSDDVFYLEPRSGDQRSTRTGRTTYRRVWKCRNKECKRQFSCLVGTIFEGTKIPLGKWIMAIHMMCSGKNGVAALELSRSLEITYKSAWHMVNRIRSAMSNTKGRRMAGVVVADEAFIGGNPNKRNAKGRANAARNWKGNDKTDKTPVFSIVDKRTGEVRSHVVRNVRAGTLEPILAENVDRLGTILYTDSGEQYTNLGRRFVQHHKVDHSKGEYVNYETGATTNIAECFFGQLKGAITGTYHGVSDEHLQRYVSEFDLRFSTCHDADSERAQRVIDQANGVKLSYQSLIEDGPFARGRWKMPPGRPGPRTAALSVLRPPSLGEG